MFQYRVKDFLATKGIKPVANSLIKIGIGRNTANSIIAGTAKSVVFADLYKMCIAFVCTPQELLFINAKDAKKIPAKHPLQAWLKTPLPDPLKYMQQLNTEQLLAVEKMMKEMVEAG
ncbi:MAG: hypothetical protein RLZZ118_113 [Bacteroidota bacterium]|jgi:DNA-binding Xre family transcriptional regulator